MNDLNIAKILPNGDCAWLIRFIDSAHCLSGIHALAADLLSQPITIKNNAVINVIPAVDSLVLVFIQPMVLADPLSVQLLADIERRIKHLNPSKKLTLSHEIAVCYDPVVAPDVESVCRVLNLRIDELIQLHTEPVYQVDMLGFLPGFGYLSSNHKALVLPRKDTPSLQVPAGSVAIAGKNTGLYSLCSPGGWHVVGRTPIPLIDWNEDQQPMRLNPLDEVMFKAIDLAQFEAIQADHAG